MAYIRKLLKNKSSSQGYLCKYFRNCVKSLGIGIGSNSIEFDCNCMQPGRECITNPDYHKSSTGICTEHFKVVYRNYDNANYEVLNPDVGEDLTGLYASFAATYNFHKRKQNMFIMLRLQSISSAAKPD